MKQYHFCKDTPLKFHKFNWYVRLPLEFFGMIGLLFYVISEGYSLVLPLYCIVSCVLCFICVAGFTHWKYYGYISMMALLICDGIMLPYVSLYFTNNERIKACLVLLAVVCWSIPVAVYYYKRRPLFYEGSPEQEGGLDAARRQMLAELEALPTVDDILEFDYEIIPSEPMTYCPFCGRKLEKAGLCVCPFCGKDFPVSVLPICGTKKRKRRPDSFWKW